MTLYPYFQVEMKRFHILIPLLCLFLSCSGGNSDLIVQKVDFQSSDGVHLKGVIYIPSSDSDLPGVILAHMYQHSKSSWDSFAQKLTKQGFITLAFDFRGWGDSGGEVDIANNYRDVIAAANFLANLSLVDRERIGAAGASMGGMAVVCAAAKSSMIRAAVSVAAPPSWKGSEPAREAAMISPRPLLVIAGSHDPRLHLASAKEIYLSAKEPRQWLEINTNRHGTNIFGTEKGSELERAIIDFFTENLKEKEDTPTTDEDD